MFEKPPPPPTNAGMLLTGVLGTNFIEVYIEIDTFSFKKNAFENIVCKMALIIQRSCSVSASMCYCS